MKRILRFILIAIIVLLCIIGLVKLFGRSTKKTTTLGKNQVVHVRSKEKIKLTEETKEEIPAPEETKEEVKEEEPVKEEVVEEPAPTPTPEPEPVKKAVVQNNVISLPNYEEVPIKKGTDEVATNQSIVESEEPYYPNKNSNNNNNNNNNNYDNSSSYTDNIYGERCYITGNRKDLYYITVCQTRETTNAQCKYTKINGNSSSGTITRNQLKMAISCN